MVVCVLNQFLLQADEQGGKFKSLCMQHLKLAAIVREGVDEAAPIRHILNTFHSLNYCARQNVACVRVPDSENFCAIVHKYFVTAIGVDKANLCCARAKLCNDSAAIDIDEPKRGRVAQN